MTHLDEIVPEWQFREVHATRVDAPPERIFDAIHEVTAGEILFFRTLTTIRRFGRPGPESILNAPEKLPLLEVATRTTFRLLAEDPPREIVVGSDIAPQIFAAMNFVVMPDGRVSTETRVMTRSRAARLKFAVYWMLIRAGSGLIRRMWLRAIKRRAEGRVGGQARSPVLHH